MMSFSNIQVILANIHMPRFMNQQIKTTLVPLPIFNDFFSLFSILPLRGRYSHKVIAESNVAFFFQSEETGLVEKCT